MNTILVYVAVADGKLKRSSLEVLSRCKSIADANSLALEAVIAHPSAATFAEKLGNYGASKVYSISQEIFEKHQNGALLKALSGLIAETKPLLIAFASTEGSKDILGALGATCGLSVIPDVSSFDISNGKLSAKRPVMAAKIIANVESSTAPYLVSVRSGSYDLVEHPAGCEIVKRSVEISDADLRATLREVLRATGKTIDLSEAETIVAAGRGVKDEAAKALISELANVLNAGIGASRALTEAGVYDPSLQIGQTGKVVSPQLYIAVGISGAIQHVAGMANSKVIVAINKDADAPIFEVADYGIVGDLYKVLPPFIEEIKKIKAQ